MRVRASTWFPSTLTPAVHDPNQASSILALALADRLFHQQSESICPACVIDPKHPDYTFRNLGESKGEDFREARVEPDS